MNIVIIIVVVMVCAGMVMNSVQKSAQKIKGRDRCKFCKSKLKAANGQYGTTCRKCGQEQPWASAVTR
jgi:hypothetical protein